MLAKIFFTIFCVLFINVAAFSQNPTNDTSPKTVTRKLKSLQRFGETYTPHIIKISKVKLEDIRVIGEDWFYGLQLFDPKSNFRRGEKPPDAKNQKFSFSSYEFLICTDDTVGKQIMANKDKWLNRNVNVYFETQDRGLTIATYVGYVTRIELLDDNNKVLETLSRR